MNVEFSDIDTKTHGEMAVMDQTGDTKVLWSRDNEDEVENARQQFAAFKRKASRPSR